MKQKKTLSPEALAIMLSEENTDNLSEEEVKAAAEAAQAKIKADEEAEAVRLKAEEDAKEEDTIDPLVALQTEFDAFKLSTEEANTANDVILAEWPEKLKAVETDATDLKNIVTEQVSKMRLALKLPPVSMSDWDAKAVVTEFNTTKDSFMASFPVGSVIPKKEETQEPEAVATSLDASNKKALGF